MASEIRVNQIQNRSGLTTTTFTDTGVTISGILTVSENLNVGGVVTYEDVTNIDSVGVITARTGIKIGPTAGVAGTFFADGSYVTAGVVTATTFHGSAANLTNIPAANITGTLPAISGANLTNLDASDLASGTVPTARLGSGTANNTTFLRGDSTFQTVNTDLVSDTSPQLGGNLDVNTKNITFGDSGSASDDRLTFGAGTDMSLYHDGNNSVIENATGDLYIQNEAGNTSNQIFIRGKESTNSIVINGNGSVLLYDQNSGSAVERLTTTSTGIDISGNLTLPTTDAKIQLKDGNNYIQFVNADKDFKFLNAWGAGEFTFHVNGGKRLEIDANGRVILNGAAVGSNEYLTIGPNGSTACDMAFRLNNDNDSRIKFYDGGGTLRGVFGYTTYANNSTYPNFHDSFYLQTDPGSNGTLSTALWVSNSGQFIKPLTYQFLVETNGQSVSGGWTKLTGLSLDTNHTTGVSNGTYWSNSNQRFTAPVSGTYNFFIGGFSSTAEGGGTNHRYMYTFVINGGNYNYGLGGSYSDQNTPMEGGSINYKLTVNDYVEVYYYTAINATWGAGHRFYWGGYFLG